MNNDAKLGFWQCTQVSFLTTYCGKRQYAPSWNLSILMRPLEGAAIAFVAYLAIKAGIILLERGHSTPNAAGYLFIGVLSSGMFSHRAADALRGRFDAVWGRKPDQAIQPTSQPDTSHVQSRYTSHLTRALQRTAAPLGSRTVQIICQRLLQPTGRFRRRSLSLAVRPQMQMERYCR